MTTIKQLYDWVADQGRGVTVAEAAVSLDGTEYAIRKLVEESTAGASPAFEYDSMTDTYTAVDGWVDPAPADPAPADPAPADPAPADPVESALADILCAEVPCVNEVTVAIDGTGLTVQQVSDGLDTVSRFIQLAACSGLLNKLVARGATEAQVAAYFARMQDAVTGGKACVAVYGTVPA